MKSEPEPVADTLKTLPIHKSVVLTLVVPFNILGVLGTEYIETAVVFDKFVHMLKLPEVYEYVTILIPVVLKVTDGLVVELFIENTPPPIKAVFVIRELRLIVGELIHKLAGFRNT